MTVSYTHLEGFLWDASDWNEDVAGALARESGIASLGEEHWKVIKFFREFYRNNGRAPLNRQLAKGTAMSPVSYTHLDEYGRSPPSLRR